MDHEWTKKWILLVNNRRKRELASLTVVLCICTVGRIVLLLGYFGRPCLSRQTKQ